MKKPTFDHRALVGLPYFFRSIAQMFYAGKVASQIAWWIATGRAEPETPKPKTATRGTGTPANTLHVVVVSPDGLDVQGVTGNTRIDGFKVSL